MNQKGAVEQHLRRRVRPQPHDPRQHPVHRRDRDQAHDVIREVHRHIAEHHQTRPEPHLPDHRIARSRRAGKIAPLAGRPTNSATAPMRRNAPERGTWQTAHTMLGVRSMLEIQHLVKHFGPLMRGRRRVVHGGAGRGAGISRPQRRRQIDDDEDDHRLSRADRRHRRRLRPRHRRRRRSRPSATSAICPKARPPIPT